MKDNPFFIKLTNFYLDVRLLFTVPELLLLEGLAERFEEELKLDDLFEFICDDDLVVLGAELL